MHVRPLAGQRILDYGAGPGYLVESLLRCRAAVSAVDYAPGCVVDLNQRFKRDRFWCGARLFDGNRLPWDDNHFDIVCCLETIEHLLPEHLNLVLGELRRVVRPGGVVLLTTPNSENLRDQTVFCPNCCSEFHRWQHVRRWTSETLRQRLVMLGYEVRFCRGINFHDIQPARWRVKDVFSARAWRRLMADAIALSCDGLRPREFPEGRFLRRRLSGPSQQHLVAVAQKQMAPSAPAHVEPLLNRSSESERCAASQA
jgi:SAM-dependent methyltransferase